MNPSHDSTDFREFGPEPSWPQWTLSVLLLILLVGGCVAAPYVVLRTAGPWAAIPSAVLAVTFYSRCRFRRDGFGPLWLDMVDMQVLILNVIVVVYSAVLIVRTLIG
jgi:hypothetical protein